MPEHPITPRGTAVVQTSDPSPAPPSPPDWRRTHLWQFQPVRDLLVVGVIVGIVWLGYKLSIVTVPFLLALLLAYLVEPVVKRLTRRGHISRRGTAIAIIAAVVLAVLVPVSIGLGYAVVQGVGLAGQLAGNIQAVLRSAESPDDPRLDAEVRGRAWRNIRDYLAERRTEGGLTPPPTPPDPPTAPDGAAPARPTGPADPTTDTPAQGPPDSSTAGLLRRAMAWVEQNAAGIAAAVGRTAVGGSATALAAVLGTFVSVGTVLFMLLLTLFFFFFLCTAWGRVVARGEKFIPHHDKFRWLRIIRQMDRVIAGFVRGRLTICAILALYMTAAYWAIGVPAWLILGPLVGMLFIVPFIHGLGVPVAMLLMWLQAGDSGGGFREEWWWIVFAPIGVYLVAQFLDDWVLTPIIQGNNTDMDTPTILFASIAGGSLAGVYGLLLAIPVAACIKILAREFLWPRVDAWVKGYEQDFLPIGRE